MARKDYYAILGVHRRATPEEIKRAFRERALASHPDRNPGDADAARRFADVAEAWQVLGDAGERTRYDRLGPLYTTSGRPLRPDELNELVADALASLLGRRRPGDPGENLEHAVSVTLEDSAAGGERPIVVQRLVRCRSCGGRGDAAADAAACSRCRGTGRAPGRRLFRGACPDCAGLGYRSGGSCDGCRGEGRVPREETLRLRLPRGVANGQKLRLRGKGNESPARGGVAPGPDGDLVVLVSVEAHPLFRRRGNDLLCEAPLTFAEAALGCEIAVPTLDGRTTVRVPPGTPAGRSFRLASRGMPSPAGEARGDLHVRVAIEVPAALDGPARRALEQFAACAGAAAHPRRAAWDQALVGRTP